MTDSNLIKKRVNFMKRFTKILSLVLAVIMTASLVIVPAGDSIHSNNSKEFLRFSDSSKGWAKAKVRGIFSYRKKFICKNNKNY